MSAKSYTLNNGVSMPAIGESGPVRVSVTSPFTHRLRLQRLAGGEASLKKPGTNLHRNLDWLWR